MPPVVRQNFSVLRQSILAYVIKLFSLSKLKTACQNNMAVIKQGADARQIAYQDNTLLVHFIASFATFRSEIPRNTDVSISFATSISHRCPHPAVVIPAAVVITLSLNVHVPPSPCLVCRALTLPPNQSGPSTILILRLLTDSLNKSWKERHPSAPIARSKKGRARSVARS